MLGGLLLVVLLPLGAGAQTITGTVYEDVNYGGGAGRSYTTANTSAVASGFASGVIRRQNARVELYDVTTGGGGTYSNTVTTNATGGYSFAVTNGRQYRVRVVNSTVTPTRTSSGGTLIPVSVYAGNDAAAISRVGGPAPSLDDAGNGAAGNTLNGSPLNTATVRTATLSNTITATAGAVTGVDFGFSFDVVTNTRNSGQGSLRQFIINANALSNTNLAQVGQTAGEEVSIFMIPDGAAHSGLLASPTGPASALTGGVAVINVPNGGGTIPLPTITGANAGNTVLDATTQSTNIGQTNTTGAIAAGTYAGKVLGSSAGTSVGTGTDGIAGNVDDYDLTGTDAPEVQLQGPGGNDTNGTVQWAFQINAANVEIRGFCIRSFNSYDIWSDNASTADGLLVENNILGGATATSFTDPTGNNRSRRVLGLLGDADLPIVRNNVIAFARQRALDIVGALALNEVDGLLVENNEIRDNGLVGGTTHEAIFLSGRLSLPTIQRNLITQTTAANDNAIEVLYSVTLVGQVAPGIQILENTIQDADASGVLISEVAAANSLLKTGRVTRNVITGSVGDGIFQSTTNAHYIFSQNSLATNGGLGIDLGTNGATINDSGDLDAGANDLYNFPVLESVRLIGTQLEVTGWARSGSVIELFNNTAADPTNFGEGRTFLASLTEGSGSDLDATITTYGPAAVNGVLQGTDLTNRFHFIFTLTSTVAIGDPVTATASLALLNTTSEFSGRVLVVPGTIQGIVFEDPNYGGGAGRDYTTANASAVASGFVTGVIRRPGAIVERYTSAGVYLDTAVTNVNGVYTFRSNVVLGTTYTMRVVNSSVTSARAFAAGSSGTPLAVQTYAGVTNRVGGEAPERFDAPRNTTSATLASLTSGAGATAQTAQSIQSLTVSTVAVSVDFGFNFDLIVRAQDAGQGTLRQFLLNANRLADEALLAQAGSYRSVAGVTTALPVDVETSIFMVPNGAAVAPLGLRTGLTNQLTGGVGVARAVFTVADGVGNALPTITGATTRLDGTTQTINIQDSNAGKLSGASSSVAVGTGADGVSGTGDDLILTGTDAPEVEIVGPTAGVNVLNGLTVNAADVSIRGVAVVGFINYDIFSDTGHDATRLLVESNVLGSGATALATPTQSSDRNVFLQSSGATVTLRNNVAAYSRSMGFALAGSGASGYTNFLIENNQLFSNGSAGTTDGESVLIRGIFVNGTIQQNQIAKIAPSADQAIEVIYDLASSGTGVTGLSIVDNTITGATANGIFVYTQGGVGNGNSKLGTIARNVISGGTTQGIQIPNGGFLYTISRNSLSANGGLGIDLGGTGVTVNDLNDTDAGFNAPNGLLNFPVLTGLSLSGTNLTVTGYARPGSVVEFFVAALDPLGFGEGATFLTNVTEGSGADTDATTGTYTSPVLGRTVGTDNTNRFTFVLALTAAQLTAVRASGLTATATLGSGTSEFGNVMAVLAVAGTVFEDPNYGGGAGRDYTTANTAAVVSGFATGTIRRSGARVELYDATGTLYSSTTTDASGAYQFIVPGGVSYTVRVVNSTVTSARPGAVTGLLPVQTYIVRSGAADVNRVGGEAPEKVDAAASGGNGTAIIRIEGLNPNGGDNTAFVDLFAVVGQPTAVTNGSFETPDLGTGSGAYQYNVPGATWSFTGFSGIAANGSAFGPAAAPDGDQTAFIQMNGVAEQTVSLPPGSYTISFRSVQRVGGNATFQTFRVLVDGVSVGTFNPTNAYAGYVTGSFTVASPPVTTLAAMNTATTIAQSQAPVTLTTTDATGVDFGYSFDVITNTLDAGQGSLRQFLTNSNALTNANLAQSGQTAGKEVSIFMIPNGVASGAPAGLRNGLVSGLVGTTGNIRAIIALPVSGTTLTITDANTTIDGATQSTFVENSNTGTLGTAGTVGVDALSLSPLLQPEIEITGNTGIATVFSITGASATIRNLSARGGTSTTFLVTGNSYLFENNIIGSSAIAFAWASDATVSNNFGINVGGTAVGTIQNNLIGFTGNSGVDIDNGLLTVGVTQIVGNQFQQNGYLSAGGDGISLGDSGGSGPMLIQGNLFTRPNSSAVQFETGRTSTSQVLNNTVVSAGKGGAGASLSSLEGAGICYLQRDGTRRGTQVDQINKNVIVDSQASGIVVGYGQSNVSMSQNSIYGSGSLAIDLVPNANAYVGGPGAGAVEYGSGDGVTLNEGVVGTPPTALPNRGTDYPVLTALDIIGGNMLVDGYCRPGATIEFFIPSLDPSRFGEGRTYLYTRVEASVDDTDAGTGSYGPGLINSLNQGQDASASRFTFTLPFSALSASDQAAILLNGLTATATLNGNTSEFSGDVTLRADVMVTVTPVATPVLGGTTAEFIVDFTNLGPSTASGITANVQLPAGLVGVVASDGGVYNSTTGLVSYAAITELTAGQTISSSITYTQPGNVGAVTAAGSIATTTNQVGQYANDVSSGTIYTDYQFDLQTTINGPVSTVEGQLVTYSVTTTNLSGSDTPAPGVVQTATIPAGLIDVFMTNGGTYDAGTGVVTWPTVAGLAVGQSFNNAVAFSAPGADYALSADVSPMTGDVDLANNTAPFNTTVTPLTGIMANLYVTVTSNVATGGVAPGTPITFTVQQGNHGPDDATDVVRRLALAPGLTGVSVSASGSYDATTGLVTWPSVAVQATATSQNLTVTVNAPASGVLTGTASVTATTDDPVPADNVATTEVTMTNLQATDMRISLIGPARAVAGQSVTYTVTSTNAGLNPAQTVATTAQLPSGLSGVVVTGGGTYNSVTGAVTWPATATMVPGEATTYDITFVAPLNDASSLPLAARVSTVSTETNNANNVARLSTVLQSYADVVVTVSGPAVSTVGSPITYVITTTNSGPAVSNGHTMTIQLPSGLAGVTTSTGGSYNTMTGVVTFTAVFNQLPGTVGALVRTVSFTTPDRAFVTPTASAVVSGNDDPISTNNLGTLTTSVSTPTVQRANLSTTISSNVPTQTAGSPITFTVGTANNGPDGATGVVQQVALRPGLTGVVVSGGGSYDAVSGLVTWNDATLANGASLSRTVTIDAPGAGPLIATAITYANETDLTPANNRATATVTITASADVAITVVGPSAVDPGAAVTYTVTTLNNGASPAVNVVRTVQLPTGLSGVVVTGGTYTSGTGVVTFSPAIASQAPGSAGLVTNTISFNAPAASYTVDAFVSSSTADPVAANNTSSQATTTTINRLPVAYDVVNTLQAPRGETSAAQRPLSTLRAADPGGSIASYTILSLPLPTQGVLYLSGVPVTVNQVLTPAQAALLNFDPAANFAGNVFFNYTATDNLGAVGNQARYTIPVGRDNAALYTNAPVLGGTTPYQNNDPIASAFDDNGGEYAAGPVVTDNGLRLAALAPLSNPLPPGVALNPVTGLLYVSDRTLLIAGTYTVDIHTIDELAGETTQPVTFDIGVLPLPVELTAFNAQARRQDADLTWTTASEKDAAYFAVERSRDNGRSFQEVGRVQAAGNSQQVREYAFTDAGVGRQAGQVFYRLRQVDTDGTVAYSKVRVVNFTASGATPQVVAWPVPMAEQLTLELTGVAADEAVTVTIFDATGRLVRETASVGAQPVVLDVRTLATGTYSLRVSSATGWQHTQRIVKQ